MSFDNYADCLASLVDDDTPQEKVEALEAAQDALAFSHALWTLFKDQGLTNAPDAPNYQVMEKVIDSLYGELGAMTLLFVHPDLGMTHMLDKVANMFANQQKYIKEHDTDKVVPQEITRGFAAFAARLRNAKNLKAEVI